MNTRHIQKLIAPVIIVTLLISYLLLILVQVVSYPGLLINKGLTIIIHLGLIGLAVYVLWERVQEVRSGEEDDLDRY